MEDVEVKGRTISGTPGSFDLIQDLEDLLSRSGNRPVASIMEHAEDVICLRDGGSAVKLLSKG